MKKLIFTCTLFITFIVTQAHTDLSIEYVNYSNGQTFSNDTIKTAFIIRNIGTTMFHTGDTLYVNARINGSLRSLDLMSSAPTPIILTGMLHGGDFMTYNPGILLGSQTLPFFPGATKLEVCMIVWGKGISSVSPTYGGDEDTSNNIACITYNPAYTGISSLNPSNLNFQIYPNPTMKEISFDIENLNQLDKIMIMDLNGNLVKEIANNTISKQINIEQLNNGLYILKVMLKDGSSAMDKFSINK
jgi:hypothetical protein